MYYVYLLQSQSFPKQRYIGYTTNQLPFDTVQDIRKNLLDKVF